jgi:hypothetical protein
MSFSAQPGSQIMVRRGSFGQAMCPARSASRAVAMATTAGVQMFLESDQTKFQSSRFQVATPSEISERRVRKIAAMPQILRQRWIICGAFVVSFIFADIRTIRPIH